MHFYQPSPTDHPERHLNTLVAMICGLTGGERAHLSTIADHAPGNGADHGAPDPSAAARSGSQMGAAFSGATGSPEDNLGLRPENLKRKK